MAFTHYKAITIDYTQCGSADSTDWPLTLVFTDADYATIANGGKAANGSGYDIRPYADSGLTSALTFELVNYTATTGAVEMHVKIPTLSYTSDTVIYLAVGDAALSSDGSSSSTWNSNYKAVYHFRDGSTLSVADSSQSANNLTNNSATAATGQLDGGIGLASSGPAYASSGTVAVSSRFTFTISCWVYLSGSSLKGAFVHNGSTSGGGNGYTLGVGSGTMDSTGNHLILLLDNVNWADSGVNIGTGWHLVAIKETSGGGAYHFFIDGADVANNSLGAGNTPTANTSVGYDTSGSPRGFDGTIDEVRISDVARSDSWLLAEYNNQKASSTFVSWGSLVATGVGGSTSGPLLLLGVG